MSNVETMKFNAETGRILHLMIHSLYTNKEIFIRELISNASDACDKRTYLSRTDQTLMHNDEMKISILINKQDNTITVSDTGIGMNRDDLIENLGTIAHSGTQDFLQQVSEQKNNDVNLIGQFGVGFYSSFMVADHVSVFSRKAGEEQGWMWKSDGLGEFVIEKTDKDSVGTSIVVYIRDEEKDFLDKFKIRHIVKTYSDHISTPIFIEVKEESKDEDDASEKKDETEQINSASALWTRSKQDITEEQYQDFYKNVAYAGDKPWITMHNKNEGTIEFTNLLYVPSSKPFDLFHPDRKSCVKLYVKRVYITDEGVNLIPGYLRFVRGIVDSEDLPLNISRETLQNNHIITKIRKSIVKKVLDEIKKKAKKSPEEYIEFWNNFGNVIKEGLCESMEDKESILSICRFHSTVGEGSELHSLDDYMARMKEDQKQIYYIAGDDIDKVKNSPQLERFRKDGIEVLLLTDSVDNFWVSVINDYKDTEIKSVTSTDVDLDQNESKQQDDESDTEGKKEDNNDKKQTSVIEFMKNTLEGMVENVIASSKLVDSPVCLSAPGMGINMSMERFMIEQKQMHSRSLKVMEVNENHPVIQKLSDDIKSQNANHDDMKEIVFMLFDQACILEGEPLKDVGAFAKRLGNLMSKSWAA